MQTRRTLMLATVVVSVVAFVGASRAYEGRADCPGKIVCPDTGELICRDKCPNLDPLRADCPGRIVCPLTGELVCKDRCPKEKEVTPDQSPDGQLPACCGGKM